MPDNGPAGAEAFVAQYCAANPQKLILEAAAAISARRPHSPQRCHCGNP
jgi:hypothetical protein